MRFLWVANCGQIIISSQTHASHIELDQTSIYRSRELTFGVILVGQLVNELDCI